MKLSELNSQQLEQLQQLAITKGKPDIAKILDPIKQKQLTSLQEVGPISSFARSAQSSAENMGAMALKGAQQPLFAGLEGLGFPETAKDVSNTLGGWANAIQQDASRGALEVPQSDITKAEGITDTLRAAGSVAGQAVGSSAPAAIARLLPVVGPAASLSSLVLSSIGDQVQGAEQGGVPITEQKVLPNVVGGVASAVTENILDPLLRSIKAFGGEEVVKRTARNIAAKYLKAAGSSLTEVPEELIQNAIQWSTTALQQEMKGKDNTIPTMDQLSNAFNKTFTDPKFWAAQKQTAVNTAVGAVAGLAPIKGTIDVLGGTSNNVPIKEIDTPTDTTEETPSTTPPSSPEESDGIDVNKIYPRAETVTKTRKNQTTTLGTKVSFDNATNEDYVWLQKTLNENLQEHIDNINSIADDVKQRGGLVNPLKDLPPLRWDTDPKTGELSLFIPKAWEKHDIYPVVAKTLDDFVNETEQSRKMAAEYKKQREDASLPVPYDPVSPQPANFTMPGYEAPNHIPTAPMTPFEVIPPGSTTLPPPSSLSVPRLNAPTTDQLPVPYDPVSPQPTNFTLPNGLARLTPQTIEGEFEVLPETQQELLRLAAPESRKPNWWHKPTSQRSIPGVTFPNASLQDMQQKAQEERLKQKQLYNQYKERGNKTVGPLAADLTSIQNRDNAIAWVSKAPVNSQVTLGNTNYKIVEQNGVRSLQDTQKQSALTLKVREDGKIDVQHYGPALKQFDNNASMNVKLPTKYRPIAHAIKVGNELEIGPTHVAAMVQLQEKKPEFTNDYLDRNINTDSYGYIMPDGHFISERLYKEQYGSVVSKTTYKSTPKGVAKARALNKLDARTTSTLNGIPQNDVRKMENFLTFIRDTIARLSPNTKIELDDTLDAKNPASIDIARNILKVSHALIEMSGNGGRFILGDKSEVGPETIVWHELIHLMRSMFSPNEWAILVERAERVWRDKYNIDELYSDYGNVLSGKELNEALNEEAIGWAFANEFMNKAPTLPKYRRLFNKILDVLNRAANWIKGKGFDSTVSIFERMVNGQMGEGNASPTQSLEMAARVTDAKTNKPFDPQTTALDSSLTTQKQSAFDKAWMSIRKFFDPLAAIENKGELYIKLLLARGSAGQASRDADKYFRAFQNISDKHKKLLTQYLTVKNADVNMLPQELRQLASEGKQEIENFGAELVKSGMLPKEVYEATKGEYLPRVYLWYLLPVEQRTKIMSGASGRPSPADYLKKRKWGDSKADLVYRMSYGEISDPGFLLAKTIGQIGRDMAILNLFSEIAANPNWVWRPSIVEFEGRTVSTQWLRSSAAGIRKVADDYIKDPTQRQAMYDRAQQMIDVANSRGEVDFDPKLFKTIPDSSRYGALRGLPIRHEIYDHLMGMVEIAEEVDDFAFKAQKSIEKGMTLWKTAKVPFNPPTFAVNFMSGMIMANVFGKMPMHQVLPYYTNAIKSLMNNDDRWKLAVKYGALDTTYAANELFQIKDDLLRLMSNGQTTPLKVLGLGSLHAIRWAQDKYGLLDAIGKAAVMHYHIDHGMPIEDAAILAQDALLDYSRISRSTSWLRNAPIPGAPFITFFIKATEMTFKTMMTKDGLLRMAPYLIMPFAANMISALINDLESDDPKKLQNLLYDRARNNPFLILLPWKDKDANGNNIWKFWDLGQIIPWSPLVMMLSQFVGTDRPRTLPDSLSALATVAQEMGLFNSPYINVISGMMTNKDPFTGKIIRNDKDPPSMQMIQILNYISNQIMPSVLRLEHYSTGNAGGQLQELFRAIEGTNIQKKTGDPRKNVGEAMAALFGIDIYTLNPSKQRGINLDVRMRDMQDVSRRVNQVIKNPNLTVDERKQIIDAFVDYRKNKLESVQDYMQKTDISKKAIRNK